MKRIEKVYQYVLEVTQTQQPPTGVTTAEVAQALTIHRSNASKDLNQLVAQGKLFKTTTRPVHYLDIKEKQREPLTSAVPSYKEPLKTEQRNTQQVSSIQKGKSIFNELIGSNGSMKVQVEQAKAAVLYPPKGLNCLITGGTGTGKTFFAHTMFEYAKAHQLIHNKSGKLVVFNCADYAHNPELLMSHLFGYCKGSFTGADEDKDGLVSEADGGMLFLDEVHRLPPEGQEMIFYLLDHGLYNRLGETNKNRKASVRIICATTENPESALLGTFVRRIPIVIQLPNFNERPAKEQITLLRTLLTLEANRIYRRILIEEDAVKALIGSVTLGNIGQLKSNVQLVCARGFLNSIGKEEVSITVNELTPSIKDGIIHLVSNRQLLKDMTQYLEPQMLVTPGESLLPIAEDPYELPYNLYDIIGDKAALLEMEGMDQENINNFIMTDINIHLKSFYKDSQLTFDAENKLEDILDEQIIKLTKEIYDYACQALNYLYPASFIYAMGMHISSFLKQIEYGQSKRRINVNIKNMVEAYPNELQVAKGIKDKIQTYYQVKVPEAEVYYLTVLLASLQEEKVSGRIGIVVAAHGKSTATSMVQVVKGLLSVDNIRGVDMPLEMDPRHALERIIQSVIEVDEGSGVVLLVDMGSLVTFSEEIEERTNIKVATVDMVTTPIVLEAARKTSLLDTNLRELADSLKKFRGYMAAPSSLLVHSNLSGSLLGKPKAIVAVCASGEGTAVQIKHKIETSLSQILEEDIKVLTISLVNMKEQLAHIEQEYRIIATAGVIQPDVEVPFITMEQLFSSQGEQRIVDIVHHQLQSEEAEMTLDETSAKQVCLHYMTESFTFINPTKVLPIFWQGTELFGQCLAQCFDYSFTITMVMHLAGMLERIMTGDTLTAGEELLKEKTWQEIHQQIVPGITYLEETFLIKLPVAERYYIVQLLQAENE